MLWADAKRAVLVLHDADRGSEDLEVFDVRRKRRDGVGKHPLLRAGACRPPRRGADE